MGIIVTAGLVCSHFYCNFPEVNYLYPSRHAQCAMCACLGKQAAVWILGFLHVPRQMFNNLPDVCSICFWWKLSHSDCYCMVWVGTRQQVLGFRYFTAFKLQQRWKWKHKYIFLHSQEAHIIYLVLLQKFPLCKLYFSTASGFIKHSIPLFFLLVVTFWKSQIKDFMNNDLKKVLPVAKNHIMSLRSKFQDLSQSSLLGCTSAKHIESKYHDYSFQNGKKLSQHRQKCLKLPFDLTATRGR